MRIRLEREFPSIRTEFSATLFSGTPGEWVRYLSMSMADRYDGDVAATLRCERQKKRLRFEPSAPNGRWLCDLLEQGIADLRTLVRHKPEVEAELEWVLLERSEKLPSPYRLHTSRHLPTVATREVGWDLLAPRISIVFDRDYALTVREALESSQLATGTRVGICWPLVSRLAAHLAFPLKPKDRFLSKISAVARLAYIGVNALYHESSEGRLIPNQAGEALEQVTSQATGLAIPDLRVQHPYFRMLHTVGFALRAKPYKHYEDELRIAAREYLDRTYLRLSLSGAMPGLESWREAMPIRQNGKKETLAPSIGRFGIADADDYEAWIKVAKPFNELGYSLLRQIGIGDYGRVYEAYNRANAAFPERIALKVDRILGKKKRAILDAEAAIHVGRDLARAPHLIRLYDTGKLQGRRYTYHVLQLVEGDTLDSLIGALEMRHMSIPGPPPKRFSIADVRHEFARRLGFVQTKEWRRDRGGLSFRHGLSPAMLLDLLTSVLLCLSEVHAVGYAMNDLKNDNMMMSRRGQIKGIDLDSFSPVSSPVDKYTDFMFLAASLVLVVLHAPSPGGSQLGDDWHKLTESKKLLTQAVQQAWSREAVETISEGRVHADELTEVLVRLILRSKSLDYANDPKAFTRDIGALTSVKRRLLLEDLVID